MSITSRRSSDGCLTPDEILQALYSSLAGRLTNQRVLVLIPDHTRTLPLPGLFPAMVDVLRGTRRLDFMVALGTHPPESQASLRRLVGITRGERETTYADISLLNHAWDDPETLKTIGAIPKEEIQSIAGDRWHPSLGSDVRVRINKAVFDYDHIVILGPTFRHEVVGFSGGAKYLFPGISGPEMINVTHWLGALAGVVGTIGVKDTPVRAMVHAATERLKKPIMLIAPVVVDEGIAGIFIGDHISAWEASVDLSAERHIIWCDRRFERVLSCDPPMYDELWTAAKAVYKLEPVMAEGGEVILYAPHLGTVSQVHGEYIYEIGYHTLSYFLHHWEHYEDIPLGVLAHSTHVRGPGVMEDEVEKPSFDVTLSTQISPQECDRLALGYLDPDDVDVDRWKNRESEGVLLVPKAGEMLHRIR